MDYKGLIQTSLSKGDEFIQFNIKQFDKKIANEIHNLILIISKNSGYYGLLMDNFQLNFSSSGEVKILLHYLQSKKESLIVDQYVKDISSKLISKNHSNMEKIIRIHDHLVKEIDYDNSYNFRSPYQAIKYKKVVCSGFALIFGLFMKYLDIKQFFVTGVSIDPNTKKKDNHIWNKVYVDELIYNFDITWDSCCKKLNGYQYFGVTDNQLSKSHFPDSAHLKIPESSKEMIFKSILLKKYTKEIQSILPFIAPINLCKTKEDILKILTKKGKFQLSIPFGLDVEKLIKSTLENNSIQFTKFEMNYYPQSTLLVHRVDLTIS
jgi:hypothetical protein